MDYFDEFDNNVGAMPTKAQKLLLGHKGTEPTNGRGRESMYSTSGTGQRPNSTGLKQALRSTMTKSFRRSKRTDSSVTSSSVFSFQTPSSASRDSWATNNPHTPSTANSAHMSAMMWPQTPSFKSNRSSNYSYMPQSRRSQIGGTEENVLGQPKPSTPTTASSFRDKMENGKTFTKPLPARPRRKTTAQSEIDLLAKLTATGTKASGTRTSSQPSPNRPRHATISSPAPNHTFSHSSNENVPELPPIPATFRNSKAHSPISYLEPIDTNQEYNHSPSLNPSEMDPFYLQKFAESPAWFDYEYSPSAESPLPSMTYNTTVNSSPTVPSPSSKEISLPSSFRSHPFRKPWERPLHAPPPLELGDLSNISNEIMTTAMKKPYNQKKAPDSAKVEEQGLPDSPIIPELEVENEEVSLPYLCPSPSPNIIEETENLSLLAQRPKRNVFEHLKKAPINQDQNQTDEVELIDHGDTPLDQFPGSPKDTDSIYDCISEAHSALDSERLSSFFPVPPPRGGGETGQSSLHVSSSTLNLSVMSKPEKSKERMLKRKTVSLEELNQLMNELESTIPKSISQTSMIAKSTSQTSLVSEDTGSNLGHAIEHSRSESLTVMSKKFIQISGADRPQLVVQGSKKSSTREGKGTEAATFKVTLQSDSTDGQHTLNRTESYEVGQKGKKLVQKTANYEVNNMELCKLLDIPSITETIATPMEEKDLALDPIQISRKRGSTFSFWGGSHSKRSSHSFHSRKTSTNSSTPSLLSSQGDRRTSFQSSNSQNGFPTNPSAPKPTTEKWQKNRPESIDLENGQPSGSWFSYDSDLEERSQMSHQSSQDHSTKSPKMLPLRSLLRSVKSYGNVAPAMT